MSRIVLVTNIPSPYRVELFYYMQMHLMEHEIHIIYTSKSEDNRNWSTDESKMLNSQILESKIVKLKGDMDNRYIHLANNIIPCLDKINPEIVVAWEYNPAALQGLAWCKLHRKKFIHLTDGTLYSERNIGKIQKLTRYIITKGADSCIASSTKSKEKLLAWGVKEESIFISLLTVDVQRYIGLKRDLRPGRLLYVGSMIKRKGLDLLINALPYIDAEYELHIVGNGIQEEKETLQKLAKEMKVADKIVWCGFKEGDDLLKEYREAAVFVLPTREDCFGLVLLEALCAKVPIVTSKYADGAYDTIIDGINGYIADPFDAKEFGERINSALTEKNIIQGAATMSFDAFTFESVAKGYSAAFDYTKQRKI